MKKHVKYIILGIFVLLTVTVLAFVVWSHSNSPLRTILATTFFVLWLGCSFFMQFHVEGINSQVHHKKPETMKERADCELHHAVVKVNRYYHFMLNAEAQEQNDDYEQLYLRATEEFKHKAEMYDAIFSTRTVLVYGKDHEEGKVIEITFESRPA